MNEWQLAEIVRSIIPSEESRRLLAVDVGANAGQWTHFLTQLYREVVAIEPDARVIGSMPHHESVITIRAMAGARNGKATLFLRSFSEMNSAFPSHPVATPGGEEDSVVGRVACPVITLDRVCPEGADLVKIDTEGYEHPVLAGCQDIARWQRTMFVVECHGNADGISRELSRLKKEVAKIVRNESGTHDGNYWIVAV